MGVRRSNRWRAAPALSLPREARGDVVRDHAPPLPVWAWVRFEEGERRVQARALASTPDAVLVEWGFGQAAESAWVWRSAVKHRAGDAR